MEHNCFDNIEDEICMECGVYLGTNISLPPKNATDLGPDRRVSSIRRWIIKLMNGGVGWRVLVEAIDRVEENKKLKLKGKRRRAFWMLSILQIQAFDSRMLASLLEIDVKLVQRACETFEEMFGCVQYQWPQLLRANLGGKRNFAEACEAVQKGHQGQTFWKRIQDVCQL